MKSGLCVSCDSTRIGALECLPDGTRSDAASYQAVGTMPYKPTWPVQKDGKETTTRGTTTTTKAGTLEVFVCGQCGRLETYVQDVQWVPFARLKGFSWVNDPAGVTP